jgi:hypothetical protein
VLKPGPHSESTHTSSACTRSASLVVLRDRSAERVGAAARPLVRLRPTQTRSVNGLRRIVGSFSQCSRRYSLVTKYVCLLLLPSRVT